MHSAAWDKCTPKRSFWCPFTWLTSLKHATGPVNVSQSSALAPVRSKSCLRFRKVSIVIRAIGSEYPNPSSSCEASDFIHAVGHLDLADGRPGSTR
jgi:hypothetical protein